MCASEIVKKDNVAAILDRAIDATGGILRLIPAWVPRSVLDPGKRIKLAVTDWRRRGRHRGAVDQRWMARRTEQAGEDCGAIHNSIRRLLVLTSCAFSGAQKTGANLAATQADSVEPLGTTRLAQPRTQGVCRMKKSASPTPNDCTNGPHSVDPNQSCLEENYDLSRGTDPVIVTVLLATLAALLSREPGISPLEFAAVLGALLALYNAVQRLWRRR
jgi:hypothetical protein